MKNFKQNILVVLVGFLLMSTSAMAHNSLASSVPAGGMSISGSPSAIELTFTDATYLESVELSTVGGGEIPLTFNKAVSASRHFSVPVPALEKGEYEVKWLVIGDDTHEITGSFVFAIGQEVDHSMPSVHSEEAGNSGQADHSAH